MNSSVPNSKTPITIAAMPRPTSQLGVPPVPPVPVSPSTAGVAVPPVAAAAVAVAST